MRPIWFCALACTLTACATPFSAEEGLHVPMNSISANGVGASIGEIVLARAPSGEGVDIVLDLHGLPPGPHGFHLHTYGSCDGVAGPGGDTPASAAGGPFDPMNTGRHMGPMGQGALGDLPFIQVDANGEAHQTLHVDRLRHVQEFRGHALIIHAAGDNYSDTPMPMGGSGAPIACGVVPAGG